MVDRSLVGRATEPVVWEVERGHIRAFATAIGDENPVHHDVAAARAAGLRDLLAPPTFPAALRSRDVRAGIDIDWRRLLHGKQSFEVRRPICAGDRLSIVARIVEVGEKAGKGGTMDVIVVETTGSDADSGATVFVGRSTTVILHR